MTTSQTPTTSLDELLDRTQTALDNNTLPVEIFGDDEVFKAEMERIYARCWVFVAHETEIPNPGDYVLRRIGLDAVIVARDEDGNVNVLSNYCRHRATELCKADQGNTSHFRCPYHGWIYKNNGDWLGAPHRRQAYRKIDRSKWGLLKAPKVDTYQGLIFATLDNEAPSLQEYLGNAKWMLDACVGLHPEGMRVMGPPDRWRVKTNWKTGSDNFGGDNYHADTAHVSLDDVNMIEGIHEFTKLAVHFDMGDGHTFTGRDVGELYGEEADYWGFPREVVDQFDLDALDEVQRHIIKKESPQTGTIFPNLTWTRFSWSPDPQNERPGVVTSFRQWQPIAPGVMEIWSWSLVYNFVSEEFARDCYEAGANSFSSSGVFEQDDTVVWEGLPKAAQSLFTRKHGSLLNYELGSPEMSDYEADPNWKGPGIRYTSGYGEANQRSFYRRWLKEMQQDR